MTESYKEPLPPGCPPPAATEQEIPKLIRFVRSNPPTEDDFRSHAALGKQCPKQVCPCRWASCSFFDSIRKELLKLPRFRNFSHAAVIRVSTADGKVVAGAQGHYDVWAYTHWDILGAVYDVVDLNV